MKKYEKSTSIIEVRVYFCIMSEIYGVLVSKKYVYNSQGFNPDYYTHIVT